MEKLITIIALVFCLSSCEKEPTPYVKPPLVKCGTLTIASRGTDFRYQLGTSLQVPFNIITHDTVFDIYEGQIYAIYWTDTVIDHIDSLWYDWSNVHPPIFIGLDTVYQFHITEHRTTTGAQSFNDTLPETKYY